MKIRLAVFLAFVFALLASIGLYYQNKDLKAEVASGKAKYDTLVALKDNKENELAKIIEVKQFESEQYKQRIDSLAKVLAVKPRFIKGQDSYISVTEIDTLLVTKPVYVEKWRDSAYKFNFDDSWTKIAGTVGKYGADIRYSAIDTLSRVKYSRTNIFGKTENLIYLRNGNPNTKFTKGYAWEEREKRVWLTIGPAVYVDPFAGRIGLGVSVQYPLLQFKR